MATVNSTVIKGTQYEMQSDKTLSKVHTETESDQVLLSSGITMDLDDDSDRSMSAGITLTTAIQNVATAVSDLRDMVSTEVGNVTSISYSVVSTTADGLVPAITTGSTTIGNPSYDRVLTSYDGRTPVWKRLPSNAFTDTNYYPIRSYSTGLKLSSYSGSTNCALYVPYGTASQYGVVKPYAVRTSTYTTTTGGTTANRYYGVELDFNGKMFVNVPWTDTLSSSTPIYQGSVIGSTWTTAISDVTDGTYLLIMANEYSTNNIYFGLDETEYGDVEDNTYYHFFYGSGVMVINSYTCDDGYRINVRNCFNGVTDTTQMTKSFEQRNGYFTLNWHSPAGEYAWLTIFKIR